MPEDLKIIRLDLSAVRKAAKVLALAFENDPKSVYMLPDPAGRKKALRRIFEFSLRYGILHGECYAIAPKMDGVAIWLPSDNVSMKPANIIRSGIIGLLRGVNARVLSRLLRVTRYSISLQKDSRQSRHYYLFLLAVKPQCQGKGYASALLGAMFKRLDEEKLPCYLATYNENNLPIYERHGFKLVASHFVPKTNMKHFSMLRENIKVAAN